MVGMTAEELRKIIEGINVRAATCYDPQGTTRKMILDNVIEQSSSYEAFDSNLKLQLMLNPISHKADLKQLIARSVETTWLLNPISSWMNEASSPRALVIMGGAGQGKSSISAAICDQLFGMNRDQKTIYSSSAPFPIAAAHFLKFSDVRRLDTVKMIKWLCFQLAKQIPQFETELLKLSAIDVGKLTDFDEAFDLLLSILPKLIDKPVFILIDAIDEADPIEVQLSSGSEVRYVKPCANRTMYMLASCLVPRLPPNFKFILTTRPDAMSGGIRGTLTRTFGADGVVFIDNPSSLRASSTSARSEEGKVMVFDHIYKECKLKNLGIIYSSCATLEDTYAGYKAIFDAHKPSEDEMRLLNILVAGQEPLSVSLLESMLSALLISSLPGSPTLILVQEHKTNFVHKSFIDWLRDKMLSGKYAVDELQGHALLAMRLLKEVVSAADAKDGSPAVMASEYCLKYALHHLCLAIAGGKMDLSLLNYCLGKWEFLRQVFKSGNGDKILPALGHLQASLDSQPKESKSYLLDSLSWIKRYLSDFMRYPDEMEAITIGSNHAPLNKRQFKEALVRARPKYYVSKVMGDPQLEWPADEMTFKVSGLMHASSCHDELGVMRERRERERGRGEQCNDVIDMT